MEQVISTITNPKDPNFWTAIGVVVATLVALGGILGWVLTNILNNWISKTSKILIQAMTEIFLDWVKVKSKSQTVEEENIRI